MVANSVYMVKTWTGEEKPLKKVVMFPEIDQSGIVFYKIEGQLNIDYFMINYYYDREKATDEFLKLLDALINFQTDYLHNI